MYFQVTFVFKHFPHIDILNKVFTIDQHNYALYPYIYKEDNIDKNVKDICLNFFKSEIRENYIGKEDNVDKTVMDICLIFSSYEM